ncbi:MAG: PD-(D/E)XK nuclease family protein [Nitrosomonas sp.]|nr:MAG: PD-(D/E)XK nuclease family protein [Nitrosomonas sp.]
MAVITAASSQFPQIPFDEVFKRVNAGTQVVTPNRRLALALKERFNQQQIGQHKTVWYPIDVLPFTALLEHIYLDALFSERFSPLPSLLTAAQQQLLWESVIRDSPYGQTLLRIPQTARWAQEAWQLAHAWCLADRLRDYPFNEDARVFQEWANRFATITADNRYIDSARLGDFVAQRYDTLAIKKPSTLICCGFDVFTPQQTAFLIKLQATGCRVLLAGTVSQHYRRENSRLRVEYVDTQEEIHQAVQWARDRLEADHAARIGIVVPELARYRGALVRIFNAVIYPDVRHALPGVQHPDAPFNVSLGLPLAAYPLVDTALQSLALLDREVEYARISQWMRSPFLAGGESEMGCRALLDARCRKYAEPVVTLERLVAMVRQADGEADCPGLWQILSKLLDLRRMRLPSKAGYTVFAGIVAEILRLVGFPGERSLDSAEFQTLEKWRSLIAEFAVLDRVDGPISYREGVRRLQQMADETLFQPETPDAPVQVLGILEAAGMTFDHLWVMGLSAEGWPLRARPNPFLPLALQHDARLPLGSAGETLAFCKRLTNGWLNGAPEVVFSSSRYSDDRDGHALSPSPLIRAIPQGEPVYVKIPLHREAIVAACVLQALEDNHAKPRAHGLIRGGTAVLKDYAACSFRAWAKHRLAIEPLEHPRVGLDAMERGALVHHALAALWSDLKSKAALDAITDSDLESVLETIASQTVSEWRSSRSGALTGRAASIEKRRLVKLMRTWLIREKARDPFTVIAIEEKRPVQIGGLQLSARLDRVDELENKQHLVIDYKTGKQSAAAMLGARPDEPQLPLYLVLTEAWQQAAGAAFAVVKPGDMGFAGIVRDEYLLPGVKAYRQIDGCKQFETWNDVLSAWRQNLTDLADGFCSGDAHVSPKNMLLTCAYCALHPLCRIHERLDGRMMGQVSGDE